MGHTRIGITYLGFRAYTYRVDVQKKVGWLFVRKDESIVVTRDSNALVLHICGPGSAEHSHHFDSEATLEDFQTWYEERLETGGWILKGALERRVHVGSSDVRQGPERRRRGGSSQNLKPNAFDQP